MNQVARVFVVINLVLAAAFLMGAATFLKQNEDWKGKHGQLQDDMQAQLDDKAQQINDLDAEIRRLNDDKTRLSNEVSTLEGTRSNLETQLQAANEAKQTADSAAQTASATNGRLTEQIGSVTAQMQDFSSLIERYRNEAADKLAEASAANEARAAAAADADQKGREIASLGRQIELLNGQLSDTQAKLASYVSVYPPPARPSQPKIEGTVVRFDRDTDLIELNIGKNQGVQRGFTFDITRGSNYVCTVRVDRVGDNTSVASIEIQVTRPQSGDRVTKLT